MLQDIVIFMYNEFNCKINTYNQKIPRDSLFQAVSAL